MSQPIIVFDLDGTLIDTAPDLARQPQPQPGAGGLAAAARGGFRQFVGQGGRVMIERAHAAQQKTLDIEEHDRLLRTVPRTLRPQHSRQVAALIPAWSGGDRPFR